MCEGGSQAGLWEVNQQTAAHLGREECQALKWSARNTFLGAGICKNKPGLQSKRAEGEVEAVPACGERHEEGAGLLPEPSLLSWGGVEVLIVVLQGRARILSRKGKEERVCGCGGDAVDRLCYTMWAVQAKCSSKVGEHGEVLLV